jgi:DNA-binding transcriptional MerR regulator
MTLQRDPDATQRDDGWRIDDLAQRAGVSVDTIRYYQREGLLRTGERVGRTLRYGPEHLDRLERIRGLQARRFSLAAIHALLEHEGPIDTLLAPREGASYDHAALVGASGSTSAFVEALEQARFLQPPAVLGRPEDPGHETYDGDDVDVLRAFRDLSELGVPDDVLVAIGVLVTERTEQLHHAIVGLFSGADGPGWDPDARARFERDRIEQRDRLLRDMRVVLMYAEYRSAQRVALAELQRVDRSAAADRPSGLRP